MHPARSLAAAWLSMLLLAFALPAGAQTFPKFTGFVVDAANVIPADQEAALTTRLDALQKANGRQLVVATIPDLEGYPIEDYGNRLLRSWGVGLKDADNGAILIVAPKDRQVRIEVGYGLEPVLTDALSSVVINRDVLPRFKAGDMPGGIVAGANAVADQLALPDAEALAKAKAAAATYDKANRRRGSGSASGGVPFGLIVWGIIMAVVVVSMLRGRKGGKDGPWGPRYRRRGGGSGALPIVLWSIANEIGRNAGSGGGSSGWGGGGSGGGGWMGGGFGGGGGGSGGGGGASGSW